jgi:hypothetical protein
LTFPAGLQTSPWITHRVASTLSPNRAISAGQTRASASVKSRGGSPGLRGAKNAPKTQAVLSQRTRLQAPKQQQPRKQPQQHGVCALQPKKRWPRWQAVHRWLQARHCLPRPPSVSCSTHSKANRWEAWRRWARISCAPFHSSTAMATSPCVQNRRLSHLCWHHHLQRRPRLHPATQLAETRNDATVTLTIYSTLTSKNAVTV